MGTGAAVWWRHEVAVLVSSCSRAEAGQGEAGCSFEAQRGAGCVLVGGRGGDGGDMGRAAHIKLDLAAVVLAAQHADRPAGWACGG